MLDPKYKQEGASRQERAQASAERICLIVLGMHRGGTSALTGVVARLGADLPRTIQLGNADNPRGYWESRTLVAFHDRLLASAGSDWRDFEPLNPDWSKSPRADSFAAELQELLASEYGTAHLMLVKDPRMCRFLPFWLDQLKSLNITPRIIIDLRNPLEVAESLSQRDGFSVTQSLLLWLRHMLDAEAATRGLVRTFASYDDLLTDWRAAAERLGEDLGLHWPKRSGKVEHEIDKFLSQALRHHEVSPEQLTMRRDVFDWAKTAFSILQEMARKEAPDERDLARLDEVKEAFDTACGAFGPLIAELNETTERAVTKATNLEARRGELIARMGEMKAQAAADLKAQEAKFNDTIAERAEQITELRGILAEGVRRRAELEAQTAELATTIADRDQQLEELSATLEERDSEIAEIKGSVGWRITSAFARLAEVPPLLTRYLGGVAKIIWWTLTFQLPFKLLKRRRMRREAEILRASGLFDQDWYLAHYPDVAAMGTDPVLHYLAFGAAEGRQPGPLFDTTWYLSQNPDVAAAGVNPLAHYLRFGAGEGRGKDNATVAAHDKSDPFASVYWGYWNQALETNPVDVRGALSARPVKADRCDVKLIAYYLPQFHPVPENDLWWGRGFTEWQNVAKATPVFTGHYQPKLPGELGFYDLRVIDVLHRQVELARHYGISAFCFHFYWFGGKRLLEGPTLSFLENKDLDLSFCLCWANENWTRKWDGAEDHILIGQRHSPEDDVAFIRYLKKYFDDPRYLKIDGKPILTVYRPGTLPDARETVARWRAEAEAMGLPGLYLVATNTFGFTDFEGVGFDALSEFPPHGVATPHIRDSLNFMVKHWGGVFSYADVARTESQKTTSDRKVWPGVMPAWDNCARLPARGHVFHGSTPLLFHKWLDAAIVRARANAPEERFVVINAWNEWAEGAYLEPDRRVAYGYLAACGSAVTDNAPPDTQVEAFLAETRSGFSPHHANAVVLHLFYETMAEDFARYIQAFGDLDVYITVPKDISLHDAQKIAASFPGAYIQEVENRGRDMLPFLTIYDAVQRGNHRFVCKLHTKRSEHVDGGHMWRDELVGTLLSPEARGMLRRADAKTGILASKGALASLEDEFVRRHSADRIRSLAENIGVEIALDEPFVAGSMFWFRPQALELFSRLAATDAFEPELGQIDGTLAHALERMTIIAARAAGFEVEEIEGSAVRARQY